MIIFFFNYHIVRDKYYFFEVEHLTTKIPNKNYQGIKRGKMMCKNNNKEIDIIGSKKNQPFFKRILLHFLHVI